MAGRGINSIAMGTPLPSSEIVFVISDDPDGGFTAHALGQSIVTQGDTYDQLKHNVREAVRCHFDDTAQRPSVIRLHWVRDEVIAA